LDSIPTTNESTLVVTLESIVSVSVFDKLGCKITFNVTLVYLHSADKCNADKSGMLLVRSTARMEEDGQPFLVTI